VEARAGLAHVSDAFLLTWIHRQPEVIVMKTLAAAEGWAGGFGE
jgi:hypothetical protein